MNGGEIQCSASGGAGGWQDMKNLLLGFLDAPPALATDWVCTRRNFLRNIKLRDDRPIVE